MVIMLNFPPPEGGIHHQEPNTTLFIGKTEIGKGTLYITETVFCWVATKGDGFSLEYQGINIHAVSRDLTYFPHECLFLMIDGEICLSDISDGAEESDLVKHLNALKLGEAEDDYPTELRFVPENKNMLDVMFRALADCQALNPDPEDEFDDDDECNLPAFNIEYGNIGEEEWEEEENGSDMDEDQFEDAED